SVSLEMLHHWARVGGCVLPGNKVERHCCVFGVNRVSSSLLVSEGPSLCQRDTPTDPPTTLIDHHETRSLTRTTENLFDQALSYSPTSIKPPTPCERWVEFPAWKSALTKQAVNHSRDQPPIPTGRTGVPPWVALMFLRRLT